MTLPPPGRAPEEVTLTLPGGVPLVMVRVPAGTFRMGSPISERNRWYDETLHTVTVSRDYWLGKYEVTQAQWQAVMGTNPSFSRACGGDCPVEMVSWNEIRGPGGFLEKLNGLLEGPDFRLPTEAEWERAARAGTQTRFSFGDALSGDDYCGMDAEAGSYAWWCANAGGAARPVGKKAANAFGLHDMHGNAWEWVEDWYGSYPATAQSDPTGPAAGTARVQRGGGWGSGLRGARSAFRVADPPDARAFDLGFRLARSP
jgi:formylglycine-generating enzyme required for sulfatase activity